MWRAWKPDEKPPAQIDFQTQLVVWVKLPVGDRIPSKGNGIAITSAQLDRDGVLGCGIKLSGGPGTEIATPFGLAVVPRAGVKKLHVMALSNERLDVPPPQPVAVPVLHR